MPAKEIKRNIIAPTISSLDLLREILIITIIAIMMDNILAI